MLCCRMNTSVIRKGHAHVAESLIAMQFKGICLYWWSPVIDRVPSGGAIWTLVAAHEIDLVSKRNSAAVVYLACCFERLSQLKPNLKKMDAHCLGAFGSWFQWSMRS
nr:hypothetical protein CFP56_24624 [Quercus suber]